MLLFDPFSCARENTYCSGCGELLVKRFSFDVVRWRLTGDMRYPGCGEEIAVEGEFHPGGYSHTIHNSLRRTVPTFHTENTTFFNPEMNVRLTFLTNQLKI